MSSILPPGRFYTEHTFDSLVGTDKPANRYLYRVHRSVGGCGARTAAGFVAPKFDETAFKGRNGAHYTGDWEALTLRAAAHVQQWQWKPWRDGRNPHLPSCFVSASFSIAYALHEAGRWNSFHHCADTHISVIDIWKLESDAWLATELVGATWVECLLRQVGNGSAGVWMHPHEAIVFTAPLADFLLCLPRWCNDEIKSNLEQCRNFVSTENTVTALSTAATTNNTTEEDDLLLTHSVERSIAMLRICVPISDSEHTDAVDRIARFAAIFCWWPKWITATDPAAYPVLLERVRAEVDEKLQQQRILRMQEAIMLEWNKLWTPEKIAQLAEELTLKVMLELNRPVAPASAPIPRTPPTSPGVVRRERQSPRKLKPYVGIQRHPSVRREEE